ncbi:hypothetical protein KK060_20920 [Fulvivirgaceae bacterium PWU20]|uniref:NAD glycohydrolase translocation F5/8 type C domain-containing protein n=1 Tax=Chryseosolibacter indicus TaxID=2782351 RepID=A0ABS5W0F8_9BACT|nr:hypothetical protein [Chryseosolibacter indicus]MBT1705766.1 hypothetical protein [Chryseosolibacter indicus]
MGILTAIFLTVHTFVSAQNTIKEIKPSEVLPLNLSNEGAAQFQKDREKFVEVSRKLNTGSKVEELSADEVRVLNETDETMEDYWDVVGGGCNWYCGGGPNEVTASSELKPQGANSYQGKNAHDLSYKTAWLRVCRDMASVNLCRIRFQATVLE